MFVDEIEMCGFYMRAARDSERYWARSCSAVALPADRSFLIASFPNVPRALFSPCLETLVDVGGGSGILAQMAREVGFGFIGLPLMLLCASVAAHMRQSVAGCWAVPLCLAASLVGGSILRSLRSFVRRQQTIADRVGSWPTRRRQPPNGRAIVSLLPWLLLNHAAAQSGDCGVVDLKFPLASLVNNNFAGQDSSAEANGDPQNIRFQSVATLANGKTIDAVIDSPDGTLSQCDGSNCDVSINGYDVISFKVGKGSSNDYRMRWSFEYTDGSGAATLPRTQITWLDMGGGEFVAIEKGAYLSYWAGSRFTVDDDWGTGGWATRFVASGGTVDQVEDPASMTADQQSAAVSVFLSEVSARITSRRRFPPQTLPGRHLPHCLTAACRARRR